MRFHILFCYELELLFENLSKLVMFKIIFLIISSHFLVISFFVGKIKHD